VADWPDPRSGWLGLRHGWLCLRPGWLGLRPDWMAQRGDVQKKKQTNRQKISPFYKTSSTIGVAAQRGRGNRKGRRTKRKKGIRKKI